MNFLHFRRQKSQSEVSLLSSREKYGSIPLENIRAVLQIVSRYLVLHLVDGNSRRQVEAKIDSEGNKIM